jgi:hypothetical protein
VNIITTWPTNRANAKDVRVWRIPEITDQKFGRDYTNHILEEKLNVKKLKSYGYVKSNYSWTGKNQICKKDAKFPESQDRKLYGNQSLPVCHAEWRWNSGIPGAHQHP